MRHNSENKWYIPKTFQGPYLHPVVKKLIRYRYIFFSLILLGMWVDHKVCSGENMIGLYILVMVFLGITFPYIWQGVLQSFLVTLVKYYLASDGFDNLLVFLFEWFSYFAIWYALSSLVKKNIEKKESVIRITTAFARALDSRDRYTACHSANVARYAEMIAKEMGLSSKKCSDIKLAAQLHDIGKIGIPEQILNKPTKLTKEEFDIIKTHPNVGYNILKDIKRFQQNGVLDGILFHHERENGSGYPNGLKSDEIPLVAKIIAVADSFDAITSKRIYRNESIFDDAVEEIISGKGTFYDQEVIIAFEKIIGREGKSILHNKELHVDENV